MMKPWRKDRYEWLELNPFVNQKHRAIIPSLVKEILQRMSANPLVLAGTSFSLACLPFCTKQMVCKILSPAQYELGKECWTVPAYSASIQRGYDQSVRSMQRDDSTFENMNVQPFARTQEQQYDLSIYVRT